MTGSRAEALAALEMAALAALLLPWTWLAARRTPLPRVRARLRAGLRPRRAGSRLSALAIGRIVAGVSTIAASGMPNRCKSATVRSLSKVSISKTQNSKAGLPPVQTIRGA